MMAVFFHSIGGTTLALRPMCGAAAARRFESHFRFEVTLSKEDSALEKQKPFGEKNKQGPQQKPGHAHTGPNKPPKDQSRKIPGGPGERSDEESIGRPVQLDKDHQTSRQPGEGHREERPRNEPAGI
jgi:hypothetical protein